MKKRIRTEFFFLLGLLAAVFLFYNSLYHSNERLKDLNIGLKEKNAEIKANYSSEVATLRSQFKKGTIYDLHNFHSNSSGIKLGTRTQFISMLSEEENLKKYYEEVVLTKPIDNYNFETYDQFKIAIQTELLSDKTKGYLASEEKIKSLAKNKSRKLNSIYEVRDDSQIKSRTYVLIIVLGFLLFPFRWLLSLFAGKKKSS